MENSRNQLELHRKPRVLCLHGFRNSGKMLEENIHSQWPGNVVGELDLVFLDGPFPAADGSIGYEWFQSDPDFKKFYNFEECLNFLENYMSKHGPFDGILGFSQGALLAGALPGIQKNGVAFTKISNIKFVIIITGGKFGYKKFGMPKAATDAYNSPIDCPSLHIIGKADVKATMDECEALVNCFVNPIIIYHPGGHIIPSLRGENLEKMVKFIQKVKEINVTPLNNNRDE